MKHYETALAYCKRELQNDEGDEAYYSAITVTITYNLARLYEALHETGRVRNTHVTHTIHTQYTHNTYTILSKTHL